MASCTSQLTGAGRSEPIERDATAQAAGCHVRTKTARCKGLPPWPNREETIREHIESCRAVRARHRAQAAAAQCRALRRRGRPCATRTTASGRPGPGRRLRDEVRAFADRPAQARPRARRHGRHHRRQPPAPLCDVRRGAEPRRHSGAGLPGLGGRRDGLRARACRGEVRRRRRTRSRSTRCISIADRLPKLERIIYDEPRGLDAYDHGRPAFLRACAGAGPRGAAHATPAPPAGGSTRSPRARARDVSVMLYTSGTTGPAQGRDADARQHRRLGAERQQVRRLHARRHAARLSADGLGRRPHLLLRPGLCRRPCACACPESPETIIEDRREIGPTYFFAPPRVFENLLTQIMVRMEDAGPLQEGACSTIS